MTKYQRERIKEAGEQIDAQADKIVAKGEEGIAKGLAEAKKSKWTAAYLAGGTALAALAAFLIIK